MAFLHKLQNNVSTFHHEVLSPEGFSPVSYYLCRTKNDTNNLIK